MDREKSDLRFESRYATRVLELQFRLYDRVNKFVKGIALLAGTGAFASIVSSHPLLGALTGGTLALAQVVEFVMRPDERALEAKHAIKLYRGIRDRAQLEAARHADDVHAVEGLKALAYNDVVNEQGMDPGTLIPLTRWNRLLAAFA